MSDFSTKTKFMLTLKIILTISNSGIFLQFYIKLNFLSRDTPSPGSLDIDSASTIEVPSPKKLLY